MNPAPHTLATLQAALASHRVWSQLDAATLDTLAPQWRLEGSDVGTTLLPQGRLHSRTGLIVSGAVDLHDPDLDMAVHLQPGDMFGFGATPAQHLTTWQATAAADSHIAWLAPDTVTALCRDHGALAYFFPSLPGVGQPPAAAQAPGAGVHLNLLVHRSVKTFT